MPEHTYSVGNCSGDHDEHSRFAFPAKQMLYGSDWDLVAADLAEDFYAEHDGWDAKWPLEFRIYEDGKEVARFSIEMEARPVFFTWEIVLPKEPAHD